MKTTIDIPESLYRKAKIRAVETGQTLRHLVIAALSRELEVSTLRLGKKESFWQRRRLVPEYEKAMKAGAFRPAAGARDVTELISEDRDAR